MKYLTQEEVCKMFQMSRTTLYRREKEGLPSIKIGKQKRYEADVVERWLQKEHGTFYDVEVGAVYLHEELVRMLHCPQTGFVRNSYSSVNTLYIFLQKDDYDMGVGIGYHWIVSENGVQQISLDSSLKNDDYFSLLKDTKKNGKKVYAFEDTGNQYYRFLGEVSVSEINQNNVIIESQHSFPLITDEKWYKEQQITSEERCGVKVATPPNWITPYYIEQRNVITTSEIIHPLFEQHIIKQADGVCALCDQTSPFQNEDGTPLLEVYSPKPLHEANVEDFYALDPLCHRRMQINPKPEQLETLKKLAKIGQ